MLGRKRRRRSEQHEKNWFRLTGYSLRPGFGDAVDSWRIEQIWPLYQQSIQFQSQQSWSDWWIFWRRVSGGLTQQQQETILTDIAKYLHPSMLKNPKSAEKAHQMGYEAMVRLSASLEHLHYDDKVLLGNWFLSKALNLDNYKDAHWWALARIASRRTLYGSQHNVIPAVQVEEWLESVLQQDWNKTPIIAFTAVLMATKTGDRTIDVNHEIRNKILEKLEKSKVPSSWKEILLDANTLQQEQVNKAFGDSLPTGLHLI